MNRRELLSMMTASLVVVHAPIAIAAPPETLSAERLVYEAFCRSFQAAWVADIDRSLGFKS